MTGPMIMRSLPRSHKGRKRSAGLVSALALVAAAQGWAETPNNDCKLVNGVLPEDCVQANAGIVVETPFDPNQESDARAQAPQGFSISIGDTTIAGDANSRYASPQRADDLSLDAADVQVRYDGLFENRRLNVLTADLRTEFRAGETVTFRPSTNYRRWIARAELRITPVRRGLGAADTTILPVDLNGTARWVMPEGPEAAYSYVLRVYDEAGRFDETAPARVERRVRPVAPDLNGPVTAAGEGEDRTARRSIPVTGGMATVLGEGLPAGATVSVMGRAVPVDPTGRFATEIYLPAGKHMVTVAMRAPGAGGMTLNREVNIPRNDWFATGLADFTIGRRGATLGSGQSYTLGHIGFYAKGVVEGRTKVTASVDTGEEELDDLFDSPLTKDPRDVLKRIDPDDFYPTYGDDSTIVEDAPTSGKIYLRVEEGASHVIWGNFENRMDNAGWLAQSRELYGAQGVYQSPQTTIDGEHRVSATVYATEPKSLPQRDQLRGTGGSVYLLQRRDLVPGSERLTVEIIDQVTGRVVSVRTLVAGQDYRIDYFQGTVILNTPLATSVSGGGATGGSTLTPNLVAQYEYVPAAGVLDGAAAGGRVETWLPGDAVRLGFTAMEETTDTSDLSVRSADVHLKFSEGSYLEAEVAESVGQGFGRSFSSDGGFTWVPSGGLGSTTKAQAGRIEGRLDLADLGGEGTITAYAERKDRGFTTLSEDVNADTTLWGVDADVALGAGTGLRLSFEDYENGLGNTRTKAEAALTFDLGRDITLEVAATHLDETRLGDPANTGERTVAGFRLSKDYASGQSAYVFARGTLDRSGGLRRDDRFGIGGSFALTDRLDLEAEVSGGTNGLGGRAMLDYRPAQGVTVYGGYELDPNRDIDGTTQNGDHEGTFILGAEREVDQGLSLFAENTYDLFGRRRSITSAYGVTYTPGNLWTYSGDLTFGRVEDVNDPDFNRVAIGGGLAYDDGDGRSGKLRLEYRMDDERGAVTRDRDTWALTGSYSHALNPDWRFIASIDALVSDSDQSSFLDGRYVEASLGYAYRPVANDRLNLLARYTYLYDLPGSDQVNASGSTAGDIQRSHIFSVDGIYELSDTWELGGKLAYRIGETAPRSTGVFAKNDAGLAAIRATYALTHFWEVTGEARLLVRPDAQTTQTGTLLTIYRSFGNNAKVGIGYNFGHFSDDLRSVNSDDQGIFLNVQAKF